MPEPVLQDSGNPGITEFEAASKIASLSRPKETPPHGPDGRFQARQPEAPATPEATAPISETDEAPDVESVEEPLSEEDIEIETDSEAETQSPSLDMPESWGKTAEAIWSALTPEAQQFMRQHETKRTQGITRQLNELKSQQEKVQESANAIEQERLRLAQAAQRLQSESLRQFQAKFGDVQDVQKLAAENPAKFLELQGAWMKVQADQQEAQQWAEAIEKDRLAKLNEFRGEQNAILAERLGLDDEPKAKAFEERVTKFTAPLGITPQRLAQYTAEEFLLVEDAMKYRAAKAKMQEKLKAAPPVPKVVKPGTPQAPSNLAQQSVTQLRKTLQKTGKVEDAAKLFKAAARPR